MANLTKERVLSISRRYFTRADQARSGRRPKNNENWEAYRGIQDWSHKADFQSQETTPSFPIAVDHIVGTFERVLTDTDDWVSVEPYGQEAELIDSTAVLGVIKFFFSRLYMPGNHVETQFGIQDLIGEATKVGVLEPWIVLKIVPRLVKRPRYRLRFIDPTQEGTYDAGQLATGRVLEKIDQERFRLEVQILTWNDYFPDPSTAFRYEIHRTTHQISDLFNNPEYDREAVSRLLGKAQSVSNLMDNDQRFTTGEKSISRDPYEIEVFEAQGDLVDEGTGEVLADNVIWTWAGDEVLRMPIKNACWDGTRTFLRQAILRIPGSAEHKALADHAVPMWRATNEQVNLILDQSMRGAWGVGQIRADVMESPEEVAQGIPQGYTAVLKPNTAQGVKFYERVDNGEAPPITLDGIIRTEGYVSEALAMPDTKLGQIAERNVKATEIVQATASSGSLYESFATRVEFLLQALYEKGWRLILQYADSFMEEELIQVIGPEQTLRLQTLSPSERFALLNTIRFRVRGLRGVASQERTFNKSMTLVNLLSTNPQFADSFGQRYSFDRLWDMVVRTSGNDVAILRLTEDELQAQADAEQAAEVAQEETVAGGQLNPALVGSGASTPNVANTLATELGNLSALAPNNPATGNPASLEGVPG